MKEKQKYSMQSSCNQHDSILSRNQPHTSIFFKVHILNDKLSYTWVYLFIISSRLFLILIFDIIPRHLAQWRRRWFVGGRLSGGDAVRRQIEARRAMRNRLRGVVLPSQPLCFHVFSFDFHGFKPFSHYKSDTDPFVFPVFLARLFIFSMKKPYPVI